MTPTIKKECFKLGYIFYRSCQGLLIFNGGHTTLILNHYFVTLPENCRERDFKMVRSINDGDQSFIQRSEEGRRGMPNNKMVIVN